jgi:hypothetical protein
MRYPDGGGLDAGERARREQVEYLAVRGNASLALAVDVAVTVAVSDSPSAWITARFALRPHETRVSSSRYLGCGRGRF